MKHKYAPPCKQRGSRRISPISQRRAWWLRLLNAISRATGWRGDNRDG